MKIYHLELNIKEIANILRCLGYLHNEKLEEYGRRCYEARANNTELKADKAFDEIQDIESLIIHIKNML